VARHQDRISRDSRDGFLVLVLRQGRAVAVQDGRTAVLRPGDFVCNDTTRPYVLHFDSPYHEVHVLRLSRAQIHRHVEHPHAITATVVPRESVPGRLLLPMLGSLQQAGNLPVTSALSLSEAVVNVVGAGLSSLPSSHQSRSPNLASYHRTRILAYVQEHLRDPDLSVRTIATAVRLSPDRIGKLFAEEPQPLSRQIWQMRLNACRRELIDPQQAGRSVSDIAFSWGFNDASHFSRSFRRAHGMSPSECRVAFGGSSSSS
jgi:AraC-like DNA-binding protein